MNAKITYVFTIHSRVYITECVIINLFIHEYRQMNIS